VRLQNIGDGRFIDDRSHISPAHYASLLNHAVKGGDVLIAALGKELPRSCVVPHWLGPAIVKADCIRLRPGQGANGLFVSHMLNSRKVRKSVAEIIHGVGRPRLNLREIKKIQVPLPPRAGPHYRRN
jgi:type I restriction enzyme S subunit